MPLTLYRRHVKNCKVHSFNLPPKAMRQYLDCECPIWMYGRSPAGMVPRQSTGMTDMTAAKSFRSVFSKDQTAHGPTLAACVEHYLESRKFELGDKALRQYRLLFKRLEQFCAKKGVSFARELTVDILETFKSHGLPEKLTMSSRALLVSKLRCFLKDAFWRGWVTESLSEKLLPYRSVLKQKNPYSDEEVEIILASSLKLTGGRHGYAGHPKTFNLLLRLMLATGMRVSDAVRFDPRALIRGEYLWVYTYSPRKRRRVDTAKDIESYITDELKQEIDQCHWLSKELPFYFGGNPEMEVYARMTTFGVKHCHPHRLRHTFAIRSLLNGLQLDDVSRLLGHSSTKITEAYYAKWVRSRKLRLERLVAGTLANTKSD